MENLLEPNRLFALDFRFQGFPSESTFSGFPVQLYQPIYLPYSGLLTAPKSLGERPLANPEGEQGQKLQEDTSEVSPAGPIEYKRKYKSLEELSRKVLGYFGNKEQVNFRLDNIIKDLMVERRRVYDIINIFQNLEVVYKLGRKNYIWNGISRFTRKIDTIQEGYSVCKAVSERCHRPFEYLTIEFIRYMTKIGVSTTLEKAAEALMNEPVSDIQINLKTKVRRLYDITNVLMSLSVIRRIRRGGRQEFYWVGIKPTSSVSSIYAHGTRRRNRSTSFFKYMFLGYSVQGGYLHDLYAFMMQWTNRKRYSIDSRRNSSTTDSGRSLGWRCSFSSVPSLVDVTNVGSSRKGLYCSVKETEGTESS